MCGSGYGLTQYLFPVPDSASAAAMGLVPVKLDTDGLYEVQGSRKKGTASGKVMSPHGLSVSSR